MKWRALAIYAALMASASSGAGAQERLTVATYGGNCKHARDAVKRSTR